MKKWNGRTDKELNDPFLIQIALSSFFLNNDETNEQHVGEEQPWGGQK